MNTLMNAPATRGFSGNAGNVSNQEQGNADYLRTQATGQAGQAGGDYNTLFNQGQQQYGTYSNLLQNYLSQFSNAAGVNSGIVKAHPGVGLGGSAGQGDNANPYDLNPNQRTYVSSQVDALNNAKQNALQAYQGHLNSQGQINPALAAEGAAMISQHFADLTNQTQAGAENAVQQQRVQDLGNLLQLSAGQEQAGANQEQAGASGTLGAGNLYNETAAGAQGAAALQAQLAQADAATNPLGSFLQLLGNVGATYATGGFKGLGGGGGNGNVLSNPGDANDWNTRSASLMPNADTWDPSLSDPNSLNNGSAPYALLG